MACVARTRAPPFAWLARARRPVRAMVCAVASLPERIRMTNALLRRRRRVVATERVTARDPVDCGRPGRCASPSRVQATSTTQLKHVTDPGPVALHPPEA